jgi:hypothetical protein
MNCAGSEDQDEVQAIFEWTNETVAKAASAREQLTRATTNPFRRLRATHHCLEEKSLTHNVSFLSYYLIIRK